MPWDETEKANVVTTIFGYDEDENLRHSAIPWIFDEWFHGDFKTTRPEGLSDGLGTKSLEEYADSFPDFRINSLVDIRFNTDGQTIPDGEWDVQMANPNDESAPGSVSPITLEGASDEPSNPFRNEYDYDGTKNYLDGTVQGPHTKEQKVTVQSDAGDSVDGVRGSIILGGKDPYLVKAKSQKELKAILDPGTNPIPAVVSHFLLHITTFYSFLDFVFIADGSKLVRVWDASVYPAHALYVDRSRQDQNVFREGIEWTVDGPVLQNHAFRSFGEDGNQPGATPFDQGGSFLYRELFEILGDGPHPVMDYERDGTQVTADTVRSQLSSPLFPDSI
jgi:hypothetical protein